MGPFVLEEATAYVTMTLILNQILMVGVMMMMIVSGEGE